MGLQSFENNDSGPRQLNNDSNINQARNLAPISTMQKTEYIVLIQGDKDL